MAPESHPATAAAACPVHVAIIMDGNGRWASARGLPRPLGHRAGVEAVRRCVEAAPDLGIGHLTLFGFSTENWTRPEDEVSVLMGLLRTYLRREVAELHRKGVRLQVIGDRNRFQRDIVDLIEHGEAVTRDNAGLVLTLALNYGGRQEIAATARRLATDVAAGRLRPEEIDEAAFGRNLFATGLPDPDILIRTSGEKRLSNFLLWQSAYAEFVFVDTFWPDFGEAELAAALAEYHRRERRFGAVMTGR